MKLEELNVFAPEETDFISIAAFYTDSNGNTMLLGADGIPDGTSYGSNVERDENFEKTYYIGDTPVYVVSNGNYWSATWMSDGMCVYASEGVSLEAMERMVNSMRE